MTISNGRKIEYNRVVMRKYNLANGERFPPGYLSTLFAKVAALEKPTVAASVKTYIFENGLEEEVYENDENVYSEEEVKNFILESVIKVTNDVTIKNENIVITFS